MLIYSSYSLATYAIVIFPKICFDFCPVDDTYPITVTVPNLLLINIHRTLYQFRLDDNGYSYLRVFHITVWLCLFNFMDQDTIRIQSQRNSGFTHPYLYTYLSGQCWNVKCGDWMPISFLTPMCRIVDASWPPGDIVTFYIQFIQCSGKLIISSNSKKL